ncbi:RMD1 family protein [Fervidobacterium pennivorans subsp. carthaginiensis]|uniref:RMD1 family protein n=1 Tax=Fervidobacterium pennivorans TaxID=93466 RepID=UPI00355BEB5F
MQYRFIALDLGDDVDIKRLMQEKSSHIEYIRWEEPFKFKYAQGTVYVYSFGAVVGLNVPSNQFNSLVSELDEYVIGNVKHTATEILEVLVNKDTKDREIEISEDRVYVSRIDEGVLSTVAFVLAQSVSLHRIEQKTDLLIDEIEKFLSEKGKVAKGRKALGLAMKILKTRHEILSDVMILDKPDIAWENELYDQLYQKLARYYELSRRYKNVTTKLDHAFEVASVLLEIHSESKANFLEWMIILLFVLEIVVMLIEKLF